MDHPALLLVVLACVTLIAIGMLAMAIGVIGSGRCLRGSCGGPEVESDGERISCAGCPNKRTRDAPDASSVQPLA